jgi:hypothetical protein
MKKLSYEERKADLISWLNALNEEGEELCNSTSKHKRLGLLLVACILAGLESFGK